MTNETFYIRDNSTRQWITYNGSPTQFSSLCIASRYANKHLNRFSIFSVDKKTRKIEWRKGTTNDS